MKQHAYIVSYTIEMAVVALTADDAKEIARRNFETEMSNNAYPSSIDFDAFHMRRMPDGWDETCQVYGANMTVAQAAELPGGYKFKESPNEKAD